MARREPRADPLRAVEEGERGPVRPADRHAPDEPARVDEAHLVEQPARRGDADRDRAERGDPRDGRGHPAQAERAGVGARLYVERLDQAAMVRPEKTVSSTTASDVQPRVPSSWAARLATSVLTRR